MHVRNADLTLGKVYKNRGGGRYKCLGYRYRNTYKMKNIISGWTFFAHNITMYPDGSIEWDYSTLGHFEAIDKKDEEDTEIPF